MLPDRVSSPGPLISESGALPIALRGPALTTAMHIMQCPIFHVPVILPYMLKTI